MQTSGCKPSAYKTSGFVRKPSAYKTSGFVRKPSGACTASLCTRRFARKQARSRRFESAQLLLGVTKVRAQKLRFCEAKLRCASRGFATRNCSSAVRFGSGFDLQGAHASAFVKPAQLSLFWPDTLGHIKLRKLHETDGIRTRNLCRDKAVL